jgi:two-component system chemotaxis response regulator CheY
MVNDQSNPDILVVEDDIDLREALAELLEGRGFRVSTATNGADALQRLQNMQEPPDVILLDLMMPVMDGYGFLDARRLQPALASIPVIVVTAAHVLDRARLGDLTPVIPKPIQLPQLMTALRQFGSSGSA